MNEDEPFEPFAGNHRKKRGSQSQESRLRGPSDAFHAMSAATKEGTRMTPQFNIEDREVFVEADQADELTTFLQRNGIRIRSDCRSGAAVGR